MASTSAMFLQATLTIVAGVIVYVISQLLMKLFIEPIQDLRKTIGRTTHACTFHANAMPQTHLTLGGVVLGVCGDTPDRLREVRLELRGLASELRSNRAAIPYYRLFVFLRLVPPVSDIDKASSNLIGWSNSLNRPEGSVDWPTIVQTALHGPPRSNAA